MPRNAPSQETIERMHAAGRERAARLKEVRAGRLVIDQWAIWPTEDGYWVLADNDEKSDSGTDYRYYPELAWALHKLLDYALSATARKDVKQAYQAIKDAEARITAAVERWQKP